MWYLCYNYCFSPLRAFLISLSRWSFCGAWVTTSLPKSPGLFLAFLLICAVVWMVSTRPLTFKSPSPCTNPLATVLRAPVTIGINVTFMFHCFFSPLVRSTYLSFFSLSFNCTPWSVRRAKSTIQQLLFFYCPSLGLVVWPRLGDLFVFHYPREFCASHSQGQIPGCAHTISSHDQISVFAHFPVNLLAHSVVYILNLFLH